MLRMMYFGSAKDVRLGSSKRRRLRVHCVSWGVSGHMYLARSRRMYRDDGNAMLGVSGQNSTVPSCGTSGKGVPPQ